MQDGRDETRDRFVTLAVRHTGRSNLRADHQASVVALPGSDPKRPMRGADMGVVIRAKYPGLSEAEIDRLEKSLGQRFPESYRQFLRIGNVGIPAANRFQAQGMQASVVSFLGVSASESEDLMQAFKSYADRLPPAVVPVALCGGGNLLCLYLPLGAVYLWDHEEEAGVDEEPGFDNLHFSAASFGELLQKLEPFDPEAVQLDPADVVSVKVKPGFADKFKKNMR